NFKTGDIIPIPIIEDTNISLTKRELEVLEMVDKGMMSKEISTKLFISIHTVNRHRQNILEKMKVDTLTEAINYAQKLGLLT
ncbi:MAG: helix-turn-helix transcriptional regulator, partial [Bacteroidales bacterium]|nr:helix-turn-helix transcriptional regulator [Bacteroidales bacterium]